jgi:hypothetical protein
MVHAYLMYGFPTQTAQETIDSLEMVRQLFKTGVLQSAFWHQFTMTAHSPVGLEPAKYKVKKLSDDAGTFANNDLVHEDPTGADHALYSQGLKKSLFNYLYGIGLDEPLGKWFDFKVPKTSVDGDYILNILKEEELPLLNPNTKVIWLGKIGKVEYFLQSKKGHSREMVSLQVYTKKQSQVIQLKKEQGDWLIQLLNEIAITNKKILTLDLVKQNYEAAGLEDFELFWDNKPVSGMYKWGLLRL